MSDAELDVAEPALDRARSVSARALRVACVGVSLGAVCGVRDHAELLAGALADETMTGRAGTRRAVSCSLHWLGRTQASLPAARSQVRGWTRELGAEFDMNPPDAVLLHYSVFSYSHRGVPLFVRPTLSAVRASRIPTIVLLHEFAYPWGRRGWRGAAWALSQRALLSEVVRASRAIVLTADFRADWVASRRWLARRPMAVAPVFSNLPPATAGPPESGLEPSVGLFGYSAEGVAVSPTLDAVRLLHERGTSVRLTLLGAPGRRSRAGEMWLAAARARGLAHALSFTDILAPTELANALAACDLLLFAETTGPTSRKTTLAASLESGRPVIALDGPHRWSRLVRAEAVQIAQPTGRELAGAIQTALEDEGLRERLGARGRAFARQEMSAVHSAGIVRALLDEVLAQEGAASSSARQVERAAR